MRLFAKISLVGEHDWERLNQVNCPLYAINAIYKIPPEIKLSQSQTETRNARK